MEDFKNPYFVDGEFKWYLDKYFTEFLNKEQSYSLPPLENTACFVVVNENDKNYVVINNKQQIILESHYGLSWSKDTLETKIKALKLNKHFK